MKNKSLLKYSLVFILISFGTVSKSATITHDIGGSILNILGNSTDNYIITGTTTSNYVVVNTGYHGSIMLRNVNISLSEKNSPIAIKGKNDRSNLDPISNVDIILDGNNILGYSGEYGGGATLQVEQGVQVNISAINPLDNASGKLSAIVSTLSGGAGIGALNRSYNQSDAIGTTTNFIGDCSNIPVRTAGGNVVISSGTIKTQGGHGAGIGGGYSSSGTPYGIYYDGMIVIYGGKVEATSLYDAAGIGSGCPLGTGIVHCHTGNSSIIVLPPASITAKGAGATPNGGVGGNLYSELGLAGTENITYIGDPAKPLVAIHTEDYEKDANIYVDLSESPPIKRVLDAIIDKERLEVNKVKFGQAGSNGIYQFNGILNNTTTFFTDATSTVPTTFGRPYMPEKVPFIDKATTVILKLLPTDISFESIPATALCEGYSSADALKNAFRTKIIYKDTNPMSEVTFGMADDLHFSTNDLKFYAANGTTLIPAPTLLKKGDVIYVAIPLKEGKSIYNYSGVLRISGIWEGKPTGYIRQITNQEVQYCEPIMLPCTTCNSCPSSFAPIPGKQYVFSGWVKDAAALIEGKPTYDQCSVTLIFELGNKTEVKDTLHTSGSIIDGWQHIQEAFTVPAHACNMRIKLNNNSSSNDVFFDDIRVHPFNASMKSYVYDPQTLRLSAELDDNNYATFYEYDEEGALIRVKKETEKGVMTIREARQGQRKAP